MIADRTDGARAHITHKGFVLPYPFEGREGKDIQKLTCFVRNDSNEYVLVGSLIWGGTRSSICNLLIFKQAEGSVYALTLDRLDSILDREE